MRVVINSQAGQFKLHKEKLKMSVLTMFSPQYKIHDCVGKASSTAANRVAKLSPSFHQALTNLRGHGSCLILTLEWKYRFRVSSSP